jgi:signal transduction histidine kinase
VSREDDSQRAERRTSDRDLSEFLLRACHDLRSSVRAIRAQAELLQRDGQTPDISDFERRLGFIVEGARRIDLLTDGLSGYSIALKIEDVSFQFSPMDAILRTALARLDKELREHGAEVTCGELPAVFGNPDRLAQVFENLLRNAVRHGRESGAQIHVRAEKQAAGDQQEWLIGVRDNGPGIDAAYLERIFKAFERLRPERPEGPGMGLAICRAIVERHGGKIWAESTPGTGSTFFFTLPAVSQ